MTESFYLIWRNQYIRKLIRNRVCQNLVINVNENYLIRNHQYLSLFTNRDKLDYNIGIRFEGRDDDYLDINSNNRDLINVVDFKKDTGNFNLDIILDCVQKLSFSTNSNTMRATGKLPPSITWLQLMKDDFYCIKPLAQQILSNLPDNLQWLELGSHLQYNFTSPCIMPQSLTDIKSSSYFYYQNLKWFVVPPNKVYKSCVLYIDSMESFEWLLENKWICNVEIDPNVLIMLMGQYQLPSHVTKVNVNVGIVRDISFLPQTLESLEGIYGASFSHLTQLKVLKIYDISVEKLEKGVLPPLLQELLIIYNYPLEIDVLPPHLTALCLPIYDCPLYTNVFPASLTSINLGSFKQPFHPFVLPNKLKSLSMQKFTQPTFPPNSLPLSLSDLALDRFKGSFDQCQPLDNLQSLKICSLVPSLATLLTNVKKLDIEVAGDNDDDLSGTCLANTSIKSLYLKFVFQRTLYPNTFPPTVRYLTLINADLKSDDVIPSGCVLKNEYR
ncbi:hypothetical protein CYY_000231 [Polysphondylium violaceum]|uniref:FNIP repeat-containing protein n=1 Tax=Polysphondylium violaceum TaxID=133409 RepID=A0A8J4UXE2_9MYCE|nr:hypothetical protein CYY_000231 [Polysphondylium violaceum]